MSISVRTVVNHKDNKREVVTIATRFWDKRLSSPFQIKRHVAHPNQFSTVNLDDGSPLDSLPNSAHTIIRPLGPYPNGFEKLAAGYQQSKMQAVANERVLLTNLLRMFSQLFVENCADIHSLRSVDATL